MDKNMSFAPNRLSLYAFFALFVLTLSPLNHASANTEAAEKDESASQFIQKLGNDLLAIFTDHTGNKDKIANEMAALIERNVDAEGIGRFVVGKYWRRAEEEEQTRFLSAYEPFLVHTYSNRFSDYSGETFIIHDARKESNGMTLVKAEINRPNAENIFVDFRVKPFEESYKIYDVVIEGVSQLQTQRSEFNAIIERKGLIYLTERMEKKVNKY